MKKETDLPPVKIIIEKTNVLKPGDLEDLCDATEAAIKEGGGFGWIDVPPRKTLENYWRGVIAIPERELIMGRLDNVVAGSCQLIRPSKNNEAQKNSCILTTFFLAPWARGYGVSPKLIAFAENQAIKNGFSIITLDVRETQEAAIQLFKSKGYSQWCTNPYYSQVGDKNIKGFYFTKKIK